MNEQIIKEQEELKRRGRLYQSEIEGVSDLLWSIALSSVSADKETVKKWFNQKIPFLNDKIPAEIIRNENKGEEMKEGFVRSGAARRPGRGFLYWNDDENKVTLFSNGLRLHADQFDKFGFALTPAYMCDGIVHKKYIDSHIM